MYLVLLDNIERHSSCSVESLRTLKNILVNKIAPKYVCNEI